MREASARKWDECSADNGLFIEPQLQLSWYWIKGMDFTTSNGMDVDQDDAHALTGRAGLVVGKKWDLDNSRYFQPYLKGGVRHEFMGDQKVTVNGIKFTNDLRGTRGYYDLCRIRTRRRAKGLHPLERERRLAGGILVPGTRGMFAARCRRGHGIKSRPTPRVLPTSPTRSSRKYRS